MPQKEKEELKSMSLGDHLEELRARLILALTGLVIGMVVCLFFGKVLIGVMSRPFNKEVEKLRTSRMAQSHNPQTSDQIQAVLVTHAPDQGYKTYQSHVSIKDLLTILENDTLQTPDSQNDPNENLMQPQRNTPPPMLQAAVIAHHPKTGFVVYATANQVANALEDLKQKGLLIDSAAGTTGLSEATAVIVALKPTEGFLVYMTTCMLFGIILTSPWLIWQIWAFVSAGLYKRERKYVHTVAPISGVLFVTGGLFFMLFVAPMMMRFLIRFDAAMGLRSFWSLQKYVNMVFSLTLVFGAAFQMPIALVFAERLGLVSLDAMRRNRKFVILGIVIVAAMATPPDPMSQLSLAVPLYGLYEASILFCRIWRARRKKNDSTYGPELRD